MYQQQQNVIESQDDPNSWPSQDPPSRSNGNGSSNDDNNNNFDKGLYKDLVEMLPLVESLMGRKANTSFTRRASLVCTKTPAITKKVGEYKIKRECHSNPAKKRGELDTGLIRKKVSTRDYSIVRGKKSLKEKQKEPLLLKQEEVENLQIKLTEKDELLRSAESSLSQMTSLQVTLDELRSLAEEKDTLIKSVHVQLSDAKINLADKQAALEKLQWEASMSSRKAEQLQQDLEAMEGEMSTFMSVLGQLATSDSSVGSVDYDATPYGFDHVSYIDDMSETEMQQLEDAKEEYVAALAHAKETQNEESLEIARQARLILQSLLIKPKNENENSLAASHNLGMQNARYQTVAC
ncbi:hypothetical protein ACHQM5_006730 [Ranunculus cassubicifolius]